jgi:hypothetical protein
MSKFLKINKPQEETFVSYKCCANGCPLNGPISTAQDKWTCQFHFRADSSKWPIVTEAIRANEALFGILDDLSKISEVEWSKDMKNSPAQRGLYMNLFDDNPELKPMANELKSKYEYRLRDYIAVQAGVLARKKENSYVKTKTLSKWHNPADVF